jgi:hypothetical protein
MFVCGQRRVEGSKEVNTRAHVEVGTACFGLLSTSCILNWNLPKTIYFIYITIINIKDWTL